MTATIAIIQTINGMPASPSLKRFSRKLNSLKEECIESLFLNNPKIFLRLLKEKDRTIPSVSELLDYITKKRNRGISDKTITRELVLKYNISRKYSSALAERLARQFKDDEIPNYLVEFYKTHILKYE